MSIGMFTEAGLDSIDKDKKIKRLESQLEEEKRKHSETKKQLKIHQEMYYTAMNKKARSE